MTPEQQDFYRRCEELGELEVRRVLASRRWNERRAAWAEAWLVEQSTIQAAKNVEETLSIGHSSKNAAWFSGAVAAGSLIVAVVALARTFTPELQPVPTWPLTLGLAGLAVNAAGTVMVFVFGVPSRIKMGGDSFLVVGDYNEAAHRREKLYTALGWMGLAAILIGAALQGLALLCA